jgi:hypothetical protein
VTGRRRLSMQNSARSVLLSSFILTHALLPCVTITHSVQDLSTGAAFLRCSRSLLLPTLLVLCVMFAPRNVLLSHIAVGFVSGLRQVDPVVMQNLPAPLG